MSFYDDASIVLIPSGYKASKLYSQKPTDGSGDLTFTRTGSTATRVNESGLIERCRTNLVRFSQDFSNAAWSKSAGTTLTHSQTDPNNGTTATRIQMTSGANNFFTQSISGTGTQIVNLSVWVKGVSTSGSFSLNSGTAASRIGTTINYTTTWARYTLAFNETTSATGFQIDNFSNSLGQLAVDCLIAFAQVEQGDIATDYIPTTSAAVTVGPIANLPRLDYTGGGCPKLLMEPTRTNLALYSQQFNNAAWTTSAASITANSILSPEGYQNSEFLKSDSTNTTHYLSPTNLINLGGVNGTFSVFAKYNGYHLSLSIAGTNLNWTGCVFDLQNGIARSPQNGGVQTICTSKIESYGNGWYKCSISYLPYTSGSFYTDISLINSNNATLGNFGRQAFLGDGTSGVYLYGVQIEAGSYATSYIPTFNASVTRNVDSASKSNLAALPTSYPFTLFAEGDLLNNNDVLLSINDITVSDIYYQIGATTNGFFATARNSASSVIQTSSGRVNVLNKLAAVFTSTTIKLYANGSLIASGSNAQTFSSSANDLLLSQLRQNSDTGQRSNIKQAIIFNRDLSDADCINLTTL